MDPITRTHELTQRYFDGLLADAELDELQRLLRASPEAADAFARSSRTESDLRELFAQEQAARREASVIEAIGRQERRRRLLRRTARLAVAACLLIAVLGPLLWWLSRRDVEPSQTGVVVVSGTLDQNDGLARVTSAEAVLRLPDGSRVSLDRGSELVMPTDDAGRLIELHKGAGRFTVAEANEDFRVETPLGRVTALGTEFSVTLTHDSEDESMKTYHLVLAVAVTYGLVLVDAGGERCLLGTGQSIAFAEERNKDEEKKEERKREERRDTRSLLKATVESVGEKKLTLAASGRREATTIDVPNDVKVFVDGKAAKLSDLAQGMLVVIERNEKGVVAIRAEGPTMAAVIKSLEKDKIVVQGQRKSDEGAPYALAKEVKVTIDGKPGKLSDVKAGDRVGLSLSVDKKTVTAIVKESRILGAIKAIDVKDRKITLPGGRNGDRVFEIAKDVKVTAGEKAAKLEDVKEGTSVALTLDKDGKTVTAIVIADRRGGDREREADRGGRVGGEVSAVDEKANKISIKTERDDREFTVTKDAKVLIDGKEGKLGDVKKGDRVVLLVDKDGKTVTTIARGGRDVNRGRVSGTLKSLDKKENTITVLVGEAENERTFTLAKEIKITVEGKEGKLDDVKEKANLILTLGRDDKTVVEITIGRGRRDSERERPMLIQFGKVKKVGKDSITVTLGREKTEDRDLTFAKDAKITIERKEGKVEDVKEGMNVRVVLDKDGKTIKELNTMPARKRESDREEK